MAWLLPRRLQLVFTRSSGRDSLAARCPINVEAIEDGLLRVRSWFFGHRPGGQSAAAQQVACLPLGARIDVSEREHAAAEHVGQLAGVDLVCSRDGVPFCWALLGLSDRLRWLMMSATLWG